MSLFVLLAAIIETLCDSIKEWIERLCAETERKRYENIDFNKIHHVSLDYVETAYRTETEEEFDVAATYFYTQMDGWQHYETQTVEYDVEDGENYCFTITYQDGSQIYRKFHSSTPIARRLLLYRNKSSGEM